MYKRIFEGGPVYLVTMGYSVTPEICKILSTLPVMGINFAAHYRVPNARATFFADRRVWRWGKDRLLAQPGKLFTLGDKKHVDHIRVRHLRRGKTAGLSRDPAILNHGNSSGYAAISLAIHLGADPIYLVGFHMKPEPGTGKIHAEDGIYEMPTSPVCFQSTLKYFPSLAADAKLMGVSIINTTMDSELTCFEKLPLSETLCVS